MPVQTGYVPDDELPVGDEKETATPPPAEVAGLEVVAREPGTPDVTGNTPDVPHVLIRSTQRFDRETKEPLPNPDRRFNLRPEVPGMLVMDLAAKQARVSTTENEVDQANLFAALGDSIRMLVVEEERQAFTDHLIAVDPPIGIEELVGGEGIIGKMMQAVTARPTPSA